MQQRSDRIHSAGFPDNNPVIAHAAPVWTPLPHSVLHRERRSIRVRYSTHTARMLSHINTRGGPVPVHSSPCTIWNDMHAITFTWIHSESLLCSRGYPYVHVRKHIFEHVRGIIETFQPLGEFSVAFNICGRVRRMLARLANQWAGPLYSNIRIERVWISMNVMTILDSQGN